MSLVVVLTLAEIALRARARSQWAITQPNALHLRSANPRLVYEMRAGARGRFPHTGIVLRTNSAGFRDREFVAGKPAGAFRIVVIGDSITVGWRVERADAYPSRLEQQFGHAGKPHVEVYNLGVTGYNSIQEVETLRAKGLRYDPDLVVVGFVSNDHMEDRGDAGMSRYFNRSALVLYDHLRLAGRRFRRWIGRSVLEEAFCELAALTGARGIPVVVVVFPRIEGAGYAPLRNHAEVASLAARHGFSVLDLLDAFSAGGPAKFDLDNVHPNSRGHAVAARAIFRFLGDRVP